MTTETVGGFMRNVYSGSSSLTTEAESAGGPPVKALAGIIAVPPIEPECLLQWYKEAVLSRTTALSAMSGNGSI
jgi:hypothetical protein